MSEQPTTPEAEEKIKDNLIAYCGHDTSSMVRFKEALPRGVLKSMGKSPESYQIGNHL